MAEQTAEYWKKRFEAACERADVDGMQILTLCGLVRDLRAGRGDHRSTRRTNQPTRGAAVNWQKARASYGNGACVEVAPVEGGVMVRDSKNPDGPVLRFTQAEWDAFGDGWDKGEFAHLRSPVESWQERDHREKHGPPL